ncbi:MAG: rane-associated protein SNARE-like [Patescibacteria group bacterium]|nr:rane-associated protein SNARE-like [Patescibacteria group bacterium]
MSESAEIIRQVSSLSYLGIFGIAFLANVVVPVPEEIVMLAIGYAAGTGALNFWITLPVVIIGAFLSDTGMYLLSYHGNKIINWVYNKFFSKIVPPNSRFISHHIGKLIFLSRFLVQLRFIGPFFAGRERVSFKKFAAIDLVALAIYVSVLMWAGHYFANRIDQIFDGIGTFKNILLILVGVVILWSVGQGIKKAFLGDFVIGKKYDTEKYKKTWIPFVWRIKKDTGAMVQE